MFKSIQGYLLAIVFLLVAVSFLVSGAINTYFVSASFKEHLNRDNLMFAEAMAKNVYSFIHNAYNITDGLAKNSDIREMSAEKQREMFAENAVRFPFFNNLYSTSVLDGMQIARAYGANASRHSRYWFLRMKENSSPWMYSNYTLSADIAVVAIYLPIFDKNDDYVAVMGGDLKLDYIQGLVERFSERSGSSAYVLDENGVVLAHPDKKQFQERYNYRTRTKAVVVKDAQGQTIVTVAGGDQKTEIVGIDIPDALHDITVKALAGEEGTIEYLDYTGNKMIGAFFPVNIPEVSSRWVVIAVQNEDIALAMLHDVTRRNIAVAVLMLVLALVIVYRFISKGVVRPINQLIKGADEIARGNLSKRLRIGDIKEFAKLAMAYNDMVEKLQQRSYERQCALVDLAVSEEKFSKAFRHYSDVIGITRLADKKILEVNGAFYDIFGYRPDEVIGHTTVEVGLWEDEKSFSQKITAVYGDLSDGKILKNLDLNWRTKDGTIRSGLWSAEAIEINGEKCSIFAWKDISELKRAQQELQSAYDQMELKVETRTQELKALNEELIASNEEVSGTLQKLTDAQEELIRSGKLAALGGLVAGVAHEINTPVGVSVTAASHLGEISNDLKEAYMTRKLCKQELSEYVEDCIEATRIILDNLGRAARLISSFKQVSADQSSEAKRVFNVKKYLDEILLSVQHYYKKTNHRLVVKCDTSLEVDSFPGSISQIITNLMLNSILHAYDGQDTGNIEIEVYKEKHCLIINYSDDGKGMPESVRERIFDPFFTTKRGVGGTGLGLYIVHNIVFQQFGGSITCRSVVGKGTNFHICLPLS